MVNKHQDTPTFLSRSHHNPSSNFSHYLVKGWCVYYLWNIWIVRLETEPWLPYQGHNMVGECPVQLQNSQKLLQILQNLLTQFMLLTLLELKFKTIAPANRNTAILQYAKLDYKRIGTDLYLIPICPEAIIMQAQTWATT